jgi:antagonist of KipI
MPKAEKPGVVVHRPGLFTTIQDLGRYGYQRYGVSVSGAMDRTALRIGNRLVGNPDEEAALEVTLQGPELEFTAGTVIAITGADLSPTIDGATIPMWTAVMIGSGGMLRFGSRRQGSRSYVCVEGGLDVPLVLGSRSTDVRAGIGGHRGRRIAKEDRIFFRQAPRHAPPRAGRSLAADAWPRYRAAPALRVILGPQAERFPRTAVEVLLTGSYAVSGESNRMGFRLDGTPIRVRRPDDLISDAVAAGAIQVPADQRPILLMADCQTTGGYPKIATVITVDMAQAGQLAPGDLVRFTTIGVKEAARLCRMERRSLDRIMPPINHQTSA